MPTDSEITNAASSATTIKVIKYYLAGRWRDQAEMFADVNISSALLKAVKPDRLDSEGNYKGSVRYLLTTSYDPTLRVEIKSDLHLIHDEIVRASATDAAN